MNFILGKRADRDWLKWLNKVAIMDNHVQLPLSERPAECFSWLVSLLNPKSNSYLYAIRRNSIKIQWAFFFIFFNHTCYCRLKYWWSNKFNMQYCFFFFLFWVFLLLFNIFLSLEMMASDSWKHLLFTSHSRTNYQLQDKRLNIICYFAYSRNEKQLKSNESNV